MIYCNLPKMVAKQGERVRFHIFTLGTEDDLHSPSLLASSFLDAVSHFSLLQHSFPLPFCPLTCNDPASKVPEHDRIQDTPVAACCRVAPLPCHGIFGCGDSTSAWLCTGSVCLSKEHSGVTPRYWHCWVVESDTVPNRGTARSRCSSFRARCTARTWCWRQQAIGSCSAAPLTTSTMACLPSSPSPPQVPLKPPTSFPFIPDQLLFLSHRSDATLG